MKQEKVISGNFEKIKLDNSESELVFVNPDIDKIYNIKTNNQIKCSKLHRFFTVNNFSIVEKEAKDFKKGDFVAQAKKFDIEGEEQRLPLMNVKKICKISKNDLEKIKEELKEENASRKEICGKIGISPREFRRVLNQNYSLSAGVFEKLQQHFSGRLQLELIQVYSNKHKELFFPEVLSPALGQIFGYFLGDGNFESRGLRFRDAREDILGCYKNLFKNIFNIDGSISKMKGKNCYTLYINSKEISEFFKLIMPFVFDYVGKSKKEVVRNFVRGFFDAEGHADKKRDYVGVSQKNGKILKYLQLLLLRLGIRSTVKFDIGRKKINVLRIIDKDVKNYLQVGFSARDKQKILLERILDLEKKYSYEIMPVKRKELKELFELCKIKFSNAIKSRPENYKWVSRKELENAFRVLMNVKINDRQIKQKIGFIFNLLNSDICFEKIREIKIEDNSKKECFYDFSVPSKQNYVANGFVVHNSTYRMYLRRGRQGSRVAKLIDSPDLPDNETVFYVTEKGVVDEI